MVISPKNETQILAKSNTLRLSHIVRHQESNKKSTDPVKSAFTPR